MQLFDCPSVRYWSKESNETLTGGRKRKFFNSRPRAPCGLWRPRRLNPVNPCRGGLPGLPRVGTIHMQAPTPHTPSLPAYFGQISQQDSSLNHELLGNGFQSSRGPKHWRMRCRRLPTTRPTPRGLQEPICPRKKRAIWTRWHLVPGKNANYLRAPSSRRNGLVRPYTTPTIVNHEYMPSTL